MNIFVACDKFRGSLTAAEANAAILEGLALSTLEAATQTVAIGDGGEGTLEALAGPGTIILTTVCEDPFGRPIEGRWLFDPDASRAVIELAAVAGHDHVGAGGYDPHTASSYGVGQLIAAALDRGAREVVVALGGSVTVDAGAGALNALGARYISADGTRLEKPAGRALAKVAEVDVTGLDPRLSGVSIIAASDVDNPLVGAAGAAQVFGPQKGLAVDEIEEADQALGNFDRAVALARGKDALADAPFAGAAGGMLVGLSAAAPTIARDGFAVVADHHRLADKVAAADLVVTGEGSLDTQSLGGKGPVALARMAADAGRPAIAFVGRLAVDAVDLQQNGIVAAFSITRGPVSLEEALSSAGPALRECAANAFNLLASKG